VRRERAFLNPGWPPPAPLPSRSPLAAADQADPGYAERARHPADQVVPNVYYDA